MQCHRPTLRAAGQSSATLWDAPRGRSDAHEVPSAPGSSVLPRPSAQHGVRGMRPPGPPPEHSAGCACSAPQRSAGGSRGRSAPAVSGSPRVPAAQNSNAAPPSSAATRCTRGCSSVRRPDVQMCTAVVPACLHPVLHITAARRRHSAPHCAPRRHPEPRAAPPQPPGPPPTSQIPHPRAAGSRNPGRRAGSSRLRVSGFWFPFLLPAVSMETGVGPGKIRLGFARGPSASACHPQPAGTRTHRASGTRRALTSPTLPPREPKSRRVLGTRSATLRLAASPCAAAVSGTGRRR